ncbi:hypothetical protein [uncultured Ferrovibrio sp.]|jgi:hypothetical protein|uniref:hypothetical protein n=1 Tax=uncultured Ferrovibrio sp. TaxID=1576913 RepID=UPI00263144B8|nr:hypothetical protein [uncultured Ferrovibrio sp.]
MMRAILTGSAIAILLAVAVGLTLPSAREPAYRAFSASSVRVDEPGENLVGHSWETSRLRREF